jgi:hypothetical protein
MEFGAPTQTRDDALPLLRGWPGKMSKTDLEGLARMTTGISCWPLRGSRVSTPLKTLDAMPKSHH